MWWDAPFSNSLQVCVFILKIGFIHVPIFKNIKSYYSTSPQLKWHMFFVHKNLQFYCYKMRFLVRHAFRYHNWDISLNFRGFLTLKILLLLLVCKKSLSNWYGRSAHLKLRRNLMTWHSISACVSLTLVFQKNSHENWNSENACYILLLYNSEIRLSVCLCVCVWSLFLIEAILTI